MADFVSVVTVTFHRKKSNTCYDTAARAANMEHRGTAGIMLED